MKKQTGWLGPKGAKFRWLAPICAKVTGRRAASLALLLAGLWALTGVAATGKTEAFPVDLREGDRVSAGSEELTFSNLWDGDAEATVTIAQDGAAIFTGLSGEGVKTWTVDRNGRYELTHTTYTNGIKGKVETAVFVVEGKEVPVSELTIDWGQKSFVYDGQPKEPVIGVKHGEQSLTKDTDYEVSYLDNVNVGTAKAIVKGLDLYVGEVTNEFTITAAPIGPDDDEPGPGPIPVGGLSKFDATYVYDGEGHTINTQALYAVTLVGSTPSFSFSLDGETGWQNDPFVYTNVGEYVMWYKITAPNYEDYKHQAKVTIQPLVLTVTFDANGGSCPTASKTVTHGATYGTLPTPTWAGHIFAGWYTAASGGDEVKDSTVVSIMAPQTLYAHWVSVESVSAKQRYPWNGLVDIVVAFEGESNDVAKVDCSFIATNSATKAELSVASITRKGADAGEDSAWSRQFVWNAGVDIGAVKIDDVVFTVAAGMPVKGGVQLWANGPYWAECNVGATKPEEYGYYFWWGDTVGYKRNADDSGWVSVKDSRSFLFTNENCPIWGKDNEWLRDNGYIDSTGNLVAAHDAATAHLGTPWRMPTDSEDATLIDKCTTTWMMRNGVYGRLVMGKDDYASKSIFLPAAGFGTGSDCFFVHGPYGWYWSATPNSDDSLYACGLIFGPSSFDRGDNRTRAWGWTIRAVRGFNNRSTCTAKTQFALDLTEGDRVSAGTEELTFSNLWDGDSDATVTIAQDGAAVFAGLSGEGVKEWSVDRNGRYVLTHTTYKDGVAGKVETAVFVVEGKEVPVSELTIDWGQKSFVYDGQPKEPVITVKDRGTTLTKGAHYLVEYKDNVNVGTAKAIVKGIEPYVEEVTNTFTITKGTLPDDVDPDPIKPDPTKPDEPYSVFDYVGVYDGEGHTIDTNGLAAAYRAAVGAGFTASYAVGENGGLGQPATPWSAVAPVFTNAATNVVWYKVSSANYEDIVHPAKVAIVPRAITIASVDGTWTYDTVAHGTNEVKVALSTSGQETASPFPEGEGIEVDEASFPTITDVGEKDNAFEWAFAEGTLAGNYAVTVRYGKLKVNARTIGDDDKNWDIRLDKAPMYNGKVQSAPIIQVCYVKPDGNLDYIPYELAGNTATDAGNYKVKISGKGNYSGTVEKDWAIMPRNLKMTSGTEEWMYDGITHSNDTVTVTGDGFVEGEGATYAGFPQVLHFADAAEPVENAFTYKLNENTKAKNYEIVTEKGKVAMTRRPISLTAPTKSKTYDGTALTFTAAEIALEYLGEDPNEPAMAGIEIFTFSNFASITEAGQVAATFTVSDGLALLDDYDITVTPGATLTVQKSATEIGVTARSKSWPYDATTHELHEYDATNLNILQPGEELVVTFKEASKVTTPKDGPGEDGKVANEIESIRVVKNGSQDVTDNYTVTPYPGLLTVTKRPVTVTVEGETVSATYDGEEHTASGYDIATEDELYDIAAKTSFGGTDEVTRTDAGKSEMGLKPSDFTNSDEYFDVTYAVTDGWVSVVPADISAGEEDFVLTLGANPKYNGTVQTIPVTAVTYKELPVTYTLAGENATHAGTYTLTVKANGNFKGERSTTWKILKRQVKLTSGSASRAYNGQPLVNGDVTVSGDGFIGVEGATYSVTGSQTLAGSSKNAFTYTLKAGTQEGDYDIEKIEGDLVVTKAKYPGNIQWNVAADAATWMYDGQPHGVTLTGVPSGVTPHLTGNAAKDVGEYTASVTFDFDAANYEPPKAPAPLKWSITARPLSLQTVNAEKPYDGFPLTVDKANITPGLSGYAEGECFDYFDLASITEVGETPATFKYRDSASAKVPNYAVSVVGGATLKVTVGGDQISVTARDGTWAYDATDHRRMEWDIVNGDKLLAGHEFRIKIDETKSVVKTPEDGPEHNGIVSNVFEYVKIVETETGADKTKNYNLFVYEGALQITNRVICSEELRVNSEEFTEKIEKTYDGEPTNVTVTAELLQPATVRYGESVDDISSTTEPEFTDAGEYVVWYTVAAQYYNTYTNKVEVKIDKRPITLTSPTKSKPFDGTALTFDGGEVEVSLTAPVAEDGDGTVLPDGESLVFSDFASITDAGRVDATFEYAAGAGTSLDNYEVTVKKGTLTVNASAEEITVTAKSGSWPYDGEDHVLHDCEVENEEVLQSGDELVVEYLPASKVTTPDDGEVENVITSVRVMRGGEDGEDVTRNYSIKTYTGKIKVVNATIRSEELRVKSEECVYDGEGHTIEVEAVGLLTSPATVVYSSTGEGAWKLDPMSVAVKNAGTHTIRYRVSAKFYNDYFGEATVKINPRPVTLLSGSATKTYDGTPLRKNEVKVKDGSLDFVDGEGVTTSCTSAQTGVGRIENGFSYEFKPGTLKDNYTIIPAFGWLEVTPGTLTVDPAKSGYNAPYDGKAHGPEVLAALSGLGFNPEACEITYALVPGDESAYSPTMPTLTDVGTQTVYVKIKAQNFEVVYAEMTVVVTEKEITDEMVQPGEDAFFWDGNDKKPIVDVQYIVDGVDICTENDYDLAYGTKAAAGWWVTVTGKGNYSGTVTKIVPVLKRPVAPPVITPKSYNGKTQKPTIPTDERWTVVANPGGINVGEYSNVVLRLTNTTDYKWKGGAEDQTDITLVFKVTRASNRWRTSPDMKGWTLGETPSEPSMGQALYGTVNVAYRRKGAAVETETAKRPELPGKYLARFWVDETENFIGLATKPPYKEVEFEIVDPSGGGDVTVTTPVPVPHDWLDAYVTEFGGGDYETAANAKGRNGFTLWESYVAGLNPTDPTSQFKAIITMGADGKPVITWEPDLRDANPPRVYVDYGKANLGDKDWTPVTDANRATMRFFKVGVQITE